MNGSVKALNELKQLVDWDRFSDLKDFNFRDLVIERHNLSVQKEQIDKRSKELNEQIAVALEVAGQSSVKCDEFRVTRVETHGPSRVIPEKLLELGVEADIIVQATVRGAAYTTVQIREIKSKE